MQIVTSTAEGGESPPSITLNFAPYDPKEVGRVYKFLLKNFKNEYTVEGEQPGDNEFRVKVNFKDSRNITMFYLKYAH